MLYELIKNKMCNPYDGNDYNSHIFQVIFFLSPDRKRNMQRLINRFYFPLLLN